MPEDSDLCCLPDVKAWLSLGTITTDDALISRLITATSADFLSEIDRYDFFAANWTDVKIGRSLAEIAPRPVRSINDDRNLILRHWPINSISSLVLDGTTIPVSPDGIQSGYYLDLNTDPENRQIVRLVSYLFTRLSNATINYNAGYACPPPDVTQAVIEWVAARYRGRQGTGLANIHIAEGRSQNEGAAFVPWDMPKATVRVAQRYKTNSLALMFCDHD